MKDKDKDGTLPRGKGGRYRLAAVRLGPDAATGICVAGGCRSLFSFQSRSVNEAQGVVQGVGKAVEALRVARRAEEQVGRHEPCQGGGVVVGNKVVQAGLLITLPAGWP